MFYLSQEKDYEFYEMYAWKADHEAFAFTGTFGCIMLMDITVCMLS